MVATVRAGVEASSFATIFNAHHRQAVRLAYLLTSDADQAEDIVAEAFAKVYVRWRKGEVRDVGAYLRRAVVNEANSTLRRRYLARAQASRRTGDDRGVRLVDDQATDHDTVWAALQQLPTRQRQAVVLRYFEDLSEADTAEILGVSVGTVKSQVSRGLDRLGRVLGHDTDGSASIPLVASGDDRADGPARIERGERR
ncbi:MAG: SigE family RNA polymerase sigma factor [Nitriliruptoraceae bacterium]|nr:SigE family RNA polymerase sigma factor [Nitriliruptoraceae bacterium]